MTITNHALAGAAIAVATNNPVLGGVFALVSHFAMDSLPHFGSVKWYDEWGKPLLIFSIIDVLFCVIVTGLAIVLFPAFWVAITVCVILATIPDWFWVLHYKFGVKHKYFEFHQAIQRYERPWGAYVEVAFALLIILFLWFELNR